MRSTFCAELNGLVDGVEELLLLHITLHQIYFGTHLSPEEMIDLLEHGGLYPSLDVAVDAKAAFHAVAATDACDPQECSLKLHLILGRDRFAQGIIRRMHWADTRGMLADGLTKGGIDRTWLHSVSNDCRFKFAHPALTHNNVSIVGSATMSADDSGP